MNEVKIAFPRWGNYDIVFAYLFEKGLGAKYITPPPTTKKTLNIGSKHSPDYVCSPFKFCLGSYIEALEKGANTLVQIGGSCRLGYYGELQEQILRDLGYEFNFVNFSKINLSNPISVYNEFKKINSKVNIQKIAATINNCLYMIKVMDEIEDFIRKNVGFETNNGSMDKIYETFLEKLKAIKTKKDIKKLYLDSKYLLKKVSLNKPKHLIKVGVVGEYYTIMEPFSNHFLEKELAKKGIIIDRWMNITNSFITKTLDKQKKSIKGYVKYHMGATSMATIYKSLEFAKDKYDGIVHVKSFGCTPEIDAMPVLQRISQDYKIPILYFSFDTQTSETGIETRLEAFHDMIIMRKESK